MSDLKEIADRCRRMETRLTKFLEVQGFDTKVKKPEWLDGTIEIPSMSCSVKDILSVIPEGWDHDREIFVTHKGMDVLSFFPPMK